MTFIPGAFYSDDHRCRFTVWAPQAKSVMIKLTGPEEKLLALKEESHGYWQGTFPGIVPGSLYKISTGKGFFPDPASAFQPDGVHGPSAVVDHHAYKWKDNRWKGLPLCDMFIYELHTGTFSPEGTFEGILHKLDHLKSLGINAIELMPVAQFPGNRNWGYDGAYPFAVQNSYGGPEGLKKLVDACHQNGIAVIMDVVYNHMGPEGNYLHQFGPYFTEKYQTPWGAAINFDDNWCDGVRNFMIQNALMWFRDYHIDALRLDAVHAIKDAGARHFLKSLKDAVQDFEKGWGRKCSLIAESDLNDTRLIRQSDQGGYGLDGQWSDDFHHALHALATGERSGYYLDFGRPGQLAKGFRTPFIYDWAWSAFRQKTFGSDASELPPEQFVVYSQTHDQVGNRALGERLTTLVSKPMCRLMAGAVFCSPYVPMIFMGEELGETNPFLYFISHLDEKLVEAVRKGRKREFASFEWKDKVPDPQDAETFMRSKLNWESADEKMLAYYRELISIKKRHPALKAAAQPQAAESEVTDGKAIVVKRKSEDQEIFAVLNFNDRPVIQKLEGTWNMLLDSDAPDWGGEGKTWLSNPDRKISIPPETIVILESMPI